MRENAINDSSSSSSSNGWRRIFCRPFPTAVVKLESHSRVTAQRKHEQAAPGCHSPWAIKQHLPAPCMLFKTAFTVVAGEVLFCSKVYRADTVRFSASVPVAGIKVTTIEINQHRAVIKELFEQSHNRSCCV